MYFDCGGRKLSFVNDRQTLYASTSTRRPAATLARKPDASLIKSPLSVSPRAKSLALHEKGIATAKRFRVAQADMIDILGELDHDRTYALFGCPSLYKYCVEYHDLAEDQICDLIAIMRKSKAVPELKEAFRDGAINFSAARRIVSVINPENKMEWLELASTESCRVIEKAIATENPKFAVTESLRYKTENRLELKLGVSEEWTELLKLVKDLASQKTQQAVDTEEALRLAMMCYIDRHDPLEKAKRAQLRSEKKFGAEVNLENRNFQAEPTVLTESKRSTLKTEETEPNGSAYTCDKPTTALAVRKTSVTCRISAPPQIENSVVRTTQIVSAICLLTHKRRLLHAAIKHAVMWRDQRRCVHRNSTGLRCDNKRWLDVHHIIEISRGGTNSLDNLQTLCSKHHQLQHKIR